MTAPKSFPTSRKHQVIPKASKHHMMIEERSERMVASEESSQERTETTHSPINQDSKLLSLPAELRIQILEYVYEDNKQNDGFDGLHCLGGIWLNDDYKASNHLESLLTCRTIYQDAHLLAFNKTNFVVSNLFFNFPERLAVLRPKQIESIRNIAFVADARHFRKLTDWGTYPFGIQALNLDTLTIILHRSSFWHYLFDFTSDIVSLLRNLKNVRRIVFVRNAALVKGSLKTWYNRLVGLIMKIDHKERYQNESGIPRLEETWWEWSFDEAGQRIVLEARERRALVGEEEYMQSLLPLLEELRVSVEGEEWNPDPRSRRHYW